jgi:hypothetical protein
MLFVRQAMQQHLANGDPMEPWLVDEQEKQNSMDDNAHFKYAIEFRIQKFTNPSGVSISEYKSEVYESFGCVASVSTNLKILV